MPIRFHDTLARGSVEFDPRDPGKVSMYACGLTVYNYAHIGNVRTLVWYDQIRRYLTYRGFDVTYVMNYTDVDDKIIERARVEGITPDEVAEKYAQAFEDDMRALGAEPPTILALATQHIQDMVDGIVRLIDKGSAYEADGDVYFSVENFPGYGKLSNRTLDDMRAGERIEPSDKKRHPLDFALWKTAKEGEPAWDSPWGPGRPGWHIECSIMSTKHLGMGFDIHGGATDLIFPHHENEIAQAEALEGKAPFARHWLHAGLVQMEAEKMSKSLGNVVLVRDLLENYSGDVARYWVLTSSYRSQATFTSSALDDAKNASDRMSNFIEVSEHLLGTDMPSAPTSPRRPLDEKLPQDGGSLPRFVQAMDDDFNSAEALAVLHDHVREGNKLVEEAQRGDDDARQKLRVHVETFLEMTSVLNLLFETRSVGSQLTGELIDFLLELRQQARAEKAFDRADAIRSKLQDLGVAIEDTPAGPRWRV
ncbi:MAG: cysteine--tRNA ligase [Actinomycetota bacterium]|nr:cysteine--tRNA ligase [Actinomycetota bacterium]